jgi:hypothetical protein
MKYIAKMMLALLASVTMVAQAYAWDFSASGSATAGWIQETVKPASGDGTTSANFSGSSGSVSLKSSHSDGDKTLGLTYSADVDTDGSTLGTDTGLDQTLSLSGSTKVGKWTSSATASQSLMEDGKTDQISADDGAVITITDGSMTYKLGKAAHLSTAEKTSATAAAGAQDAEARVDSFNGFSVGLPVGPGALTFAVDMNSGTASTLMGDKSVAIGCGGQMTGFGFNFAGNVGADLSLTYATGSSTASKANDDEIPLLVALFYLQDHIGTRRAHACRILALSRGFCRGDQRPGLLLCLSRHLCLRLLWTGSRRL